jgi:5'-3' exonuclease
MIADESLLCFNLPSHLQKTFSVEARKKGQQQQSSSSSSSSSIGRKARSNVVSSTALTPGTPFMHDVCVSCCYYICARLANRKWQQVR